MEASHRQTYQTVPSHKVIFDYWKDKCITDKGEVKIEGEYDYKNSIPVVIDWGEPSCWGCGKDVYIKNPKYDSDLDNNLGAIWEYKEVKSKLERCHIQPSALTNNHQPSNIFLLCNDCHKDSPDYMNQIFFFKFIYKRRSEYCNGIRLNHIIENILQLCYEFQIDISTFDPKKLEHNMKNYANTHGAKLVESTIIAAFVDSFANTWGNDIAEEEKMKCLITELLDQIKNKH